MHKIINPSTWKSPRGYNNAILATGTQLFLAGQIGWNAQQEFESDQLPAQVRQTLKNIAALLQESGAKPEHIVRMVWYVKDKREYLSATREIGEAYKEILGKHYPAMTLVQVSDLLEEKAKVEIDVTAVVP